MILTVHLFAAAKDLAGTDRVTVEVADGATVADLRAELAKNRPLATMLSRCSFAVNQEFVGDEVAMQIGDEVAVIPPVSGGT
jgi:molybdopterin converting factor subunit 1